MKWRVRLKDEVGLAGDPKTICNHMFRDEGGIRLIIRLIFDGLPKLRRSV
jgi:hypothetical protein